MSKACTSLNINLKKKDEGKVTTSGNDRIRKLQLKMEPPDRILALRFIILQKNLKNSSIGEVHRKEHIFRYMLRQTPTIKLYHAQ